MEAQKLISKFVSKMFSWESIAKILFWALAEILDMFVEGDKLSIKEKKLVRLVDYLGKEFGETWVEETDTELDDEALANLLAKTEDTAQEGGFKLIDVPEI